MSEEMTNHYGMTPYESYKMAHKEGKRANGVGITGLVLGSVGLLAAVTGWIYAGNQAKKAQEVATAQNNGTSALLNQMAGLLSEERRERVNGDINLTTTINDTVSGSQQGSLTQSQQLSNELTFGLMTGRYSENPQKVAIWRDAQACPCPGSCGCGN